MRRLVSVAIVGLMGVLVTAAQQPQPIQARPQGRPARPQNQKQAGPQGEAKLRFVCQQLSLDDQQKQQSEALIAVYNAAVEEQRADPVALMEGVRNKLAEVQAAKDAGDDARAEELQKELRMLAPGVQAEADFFAALEQILTPAQQKQLPAVRKLAETVGDISMRPVHVLRAAREQNLSREQHAQLEQVLADFRTEQRTSRARPDGGNDPALEEFIKKVRGVLTPNQAEAYDARIAELRISAPPATKPVGASNLQIRTIEGPEGGPEQVPTKIRRIDPPVQSSGGGGGR